VRIAFATHAYAPAIGGAERYAQGLAEAIAAQGHDVHVFTPNATSAEVFYEFGYMNSSTVSEAVNGVHVHRVPISYPHRPLMRPPASGPIPVEKAHLMWERYGVALRSEIRTVEPDAIVALPHAFPNVVSVLELESLPPVAYAPLLHEDDPAWSIGRIAALVARADIVIALTEWERQRLTDAYGSEPSRTIIVPPGVESPDPEDVQEWTGAATYVLSLGRRSAGKHLPETAEAVGRLRAEGIDIKYVVAGPGNDAEVDAALLKTGDATEMIGEIDESTKWSLLKGSLATVSMSSHESFGIAAVESWRMGRPVIARRGPISDEVIQDGVSGLLVSDSAELERSLLKLYNDRTLATAMGQAGFRRSKALTWDAAIAPLVAALYAESS
jgi:glycosyltransferase involved in cell wall biosynthesis